MSQLNFNLPLPPSKNVRTKLRPVFVKGKRVMVSALTEEVKAYREQVKYELMGFKQLLPDGEKIILECVWRKSTNSQDCANFHDELCDAIAPALGLNDKWFLVRDMDFIVEPKNAGVHVQMRRTGQLLKEG